MLVKPHSKLRGWIVAHKTASGVVVVVLVAVVGWRINAARDTSGEIRYVTATPERGTLIVSITGSGQVTASSQVDIKPKVSGDIVSIPVVNGQYVASGAALVYIDAQNAQKAVRDAEANLESARLSLEKLQKPADNLSLLQSENSLARAQESKEKAKNDLSKAYDDGFNAVASAFLDLPSIMSGLQDILYSDSAGLGSNKQFNIDFYTSVSATYEYKTLAMRTKTDGDYDVARKTYDKNFEDYRAVNRFSDEKIIETIILETYDTAKLVAESIKSGTNFIQFYKDQLLVKNIKPVPVADIHLSSLNSYTSKINSHLQSLLSATTAIKNAKDAITNAERSIAENTASLIKLKTGADELDIASSKLAVKQRENALLDAREKLADYTVRAPFAGTIAKVNAKKGDPASASTAIATIVSKQQFAELSLNEMDATKVSVGQKATLTFDAITGLTLTGRVVEIDAVGTVSQGVVTYAIKIAFDSQDARVKPGMSVSAAIITDIHQDALTVQNSAVKMQGNRYYVEVFDVLPVGSESAQGAVSTIPPRQQPVEIGLANDSKTEILSGLKEEASVVSRKIVPPTAAAPQAPSIFGAASGNRSGTGGSGINRMVR